MKHLFCILSAYFWLGNVFGQPSERLILSDTTFTSSSGMVVKAQVGSMKVLENRKNPASEEIDIHFIRLMSEGNNPKTPLFYLVNLICKKC